MSDEDSADEMEDDCKLMNGDVSSIALKTFLVIHKFMSWER